MRRSDETPVLIDFGLAREYNANPDSIRSMTNSMTECFAPIEQYQRQGKFGAWTDVYALAATLYVLLTKQMPFPARFREHAPLIPPQKHNPQVSDRINRAIVKGLELHPGDRPQTAKAWLKMLNPPQLKLEPPVQSKYIETPTILIPPKNGSPKKKVTEPKKTSIKATNKPRQKVDRVGSSSRTILANAIASPSARSAIEQDNNGGNRGFQKVSRRNWLKYSGLAVASIIVTLIGKNIVDNLDRDSDNSESTNNLTQSDLLDKQLKDSPQPTNNNLELAEYEFDVITVNDRGEEINREQGQAKYFTEDLGNGVTLEMVEIPEGTFMMGSPEDELGRGKDESPQHKVTVLSFYMAKYEVTQAQWKQVAGLPQIEKELVLDPSFFKGENLPVTNVSWYDAVEFCNRLSKATGKEYRLPSKAKWEYACRAGTTTPFHFGETITTELVNYDGGHAYANAPKGEDRETTTPVGTFPPNAFGLYDMHGNVWEWCADTHQENYEGMPSDGSAWVSEYSSIPVLRGGSWHFNPHYCRSANRSRGETDKGFYGIGFRCIATNFSEQ